jgi:hypothetical protein
MARAKEQQLYRAIETFALADRIVLEGTRLREPVGPEAYWIQDSADDADEIAAKQALVVDREQAAANREAKARERAVHEARPGRRVRAVRSFTTYLGYEVREGDVYDPNATDVAECPEAFEEIEE